MTNCRRFFGRKRYICHNCGKTIVDEATYLVKFDDFCSVALCQTCRDGNGLARIAVERMKNRRKK